MDRIHVDVNRSDLVQSKPMVCTRIHSFIHSFTQAWVGVSVCSSSSSSLCARTDDELQRVEHREPDVQRQRAQRALEVTRCAVRLWAHARDSLDQNTPMSARPNAQAQA